MATPSHHLDGKFTAALELELEQPDMPSLATLASLSLSPQGKTLQTAGERAARRTLSRFVQVRGEGYRKALSRLCRAETGCSRSSPNLAFGTISIRTVHQVTKLVKSVGMR